MSDDELLAEIASATAAIPQYGERARLRAAELRAEARRRQEAADAMVSKYTAPITRVQEAAAAASSAPYRPATAWQLYVTDPSGLTTRVRKPADVAHADQKRAEFIRRVGPLDGLVLPQPPKDASERERSVYDAASKHMNGLLGLVAMAKSNQSPKDIAALESPYDDHGILGPDSPLTKVGAWFQSVPAMVYQPYRFARDREGAEQGYNNAFNHFMMLGGAGYAPGRSRTMEEYEPWLKGLSDDDLVAESRRPNALFAQRNLAEREIQYRRRANWQVPHSREVGNIDAAIRSKVSMPFTGEELLAEEGASPTTAYVLGTGLDILGDPLSSAVKAPGQIIKGLRYASPAARNLRVLNAARRVTEDFGPPLAINGAASIGSSIYRPSAEDPAAQIVYPSR